MKKTRFIFLLFCFSIIFSSCSVSIGNNSIIKESNPIPVNGVKYNDNIFTLGMTKSEVEDVLGNGMPTKVMYGVVDGTIYNDTLKILYQNDVVIYFETDNNRVMFYGNLDMYNTLPTFLEKYKYEVKTDNTYRVYFDSEGNEVNSLTDDFEYVISFSLAYETSAHAKFISLSIK